MQSQQSLHRRVFRYARLLVGRGKDTIFFAVATLYSVYTVIAPVSVQRHMLLVLHVDPDQRLVIWGFGLAFFFLYAGFRAWDDECLQHDDRPEIVHLKEEIEELKKRGGRYITAGQKLLFKAACSQMGVTANTVAVSLCFDGLSDEARRYGLALIELFRANGIIAGGMTGSSLWPNFDEFGLAMVVGDPDQPPRMASQVMKLFKAAAIECHLVRDNRANGFKATDYMLYIGTVER